MLSSVLRSGRAIAVNIQIMRAFVRMRQLINSNRGRDRFDIATGVLFLKVRFALNFDCGATQARDTE